jgi:4-hydroxy-tetrahydrodipicolinate synthase
VRKYVLAKRGVIAGDFQREPKTVLGPRDIAEVDALIRRQDRRLAELSRA